MNTRSKEEKNGKERKLLINLFHPNMKRNEKLKKTDRIFVSILTWNILSNLLGVYGDGMCV